MLHHEESKSKASDMNTANDDKLKAAALEGNINLLYTLIQEDPLVLEHMDLIPFVETPLHIAASIGCLDFATEIMRLKPSFAWKLNQYGFSPIHLALQNGQKGMVLRFVDINKELVRVKGREGLTPLHFASQNGEIDLLANFLLSCPDSIQDVNVRSETALHIAVRNKQHEALEVLVGWLKMNHQKGALQLEKTILNWKGNTVLHVSALLNDSQALHLLVHTKIDLKAENSESSTAFDLANTAEIRSTLVRAGAKRGSVTNAPSLADKLRSNISFMDKIVIFILRIRRDISEDQRNAFLIVAALVATATYQSALSPPGGVYQANAGPNNQSNTTLNSTATDTQGTSVMSEGDFFTISIMNTLSLLVSTITIYILTPSGIVGSLLFTPMFWFVYCYQYSMKVISPTNASSLVNLILVSLFPLVYTALYCTFSVGYKRLERYAHWREIKARNRTVTNRW